MNLMELFIKLTVDDSGVGGKLDENADKAESFGQKFKHGLGTAAKVGAAALAAAGTAIVAFGKNAVDTGAKFDSAMSQVAATMGTTVDQIQELRDFAQKMGSETVFSATQAAEALNYMALAGYNSEQAMEALPNVLNLAAAGNIDLAAASDMVTDAQSALGLSMEESAEMVDKMAMASSKSNTSVAQLGEAFLTIGGTAKNLAGGTTELSTALGILADNGIKGAEGGTSLRNVVLSLSAPTDQAAAKLKELGIEVYDAQGNMRPLNETFNDLNAQLSTMTQGEQTEVLNEIFNKVDLKAVNALLANSGERFEELSGYIDDASGAAERMAAVQLDNLEGDITLFNSALEGAKIKISDELTPSLREFVQFGSNSISKLTEAFNEGGLSGVIDAFGDVLSDGLNMIIDKIPDVMGAAVKLVGAIVKGVINSLPKLLNAAIAIVMELANGLSDPKTLMAVIDTGLTILMSLVDGIANALPQIIAVVPRILSAFLSAIIVKLPQIIASGITIINSLVSGLIQAIPQLVAAVPALIIGIVHGIIDNLDQIIVGAVDIVLAIIEGLIGAIPQLIQAIPELINAIVRTFKNYDWGKIGKNIVNGLKDGIKNSWESFKKFFTDKIEGLVGSVKELLGIHSPSKVFAGIGKFMAEGLGEGWNDEYISVEKRITGGLDFTGVVGEVDLKKGDTERSEGNLVVNQYIQAVAQTPVEFASTTEAYFEQARWQMA